jgi:hypothetical protein
MTGATEAHASQTRVHLLAWRPVSFHCRGMFLQVRERKDAEVKLLDPDSREPSRQLSRITRNS